MNVKNTVIAFAITSLFVGGAHAAGNIIKVTAEGSPLAGEQSDSRTYIKRTGETIMTSIPDNTLRSALPALKLADSSLTNAGDFYIATGGTQTSNTVLSIVFFGTSQLGLGLANMDINAGGGGVMLTTPDQGAIAAASLAGNFPLTYTLTSLPIWDQNGTQLGVYEVVGFLRMK